MRTEEEDRQQAESHRDFELLEKEKEESYWKAHDAWEQAVDYLQAAGIVSPTEEDWKLIKWSMGIK